MRILAIESSCDETAVAIVSRDDQGRPIVIAQNILSQIEEHRDFGGVVPEIAARAHLSNLDYLVEKTLDEAGLTVAQMDGFAATAGPGLVGGLMVGVMTGKALASVTGKPFLAINHLEGHALTARLTDNVDYPYLLLLVSGGHTQILHVAGVGNYTRLATTIDDALGEAFDKTAKLLGLGHPGGPNVEMAAAKGDPTRFSFPMPLQGRDTLNMSFSGLKTAVRQLAEQLAPLSQQDVADICAAFQLTVARVLENRCRRAMQTMLAQNEELHRQPLLVAAGGVAANSEIRQRLTDLCEENRWQFVAPPLAFCSDNAAMIGWAALERLEAGLGEPADTSIRSRWPLDEESAGMVGSGRRGVKV